MAAHDVEATIERYYEALRAGEPLHPYFVDAGPVVKVGIWERLVGAEAVAAGLRAQTARTEDWTIESHDLHVGTAGGRGDDGMAWFGDDVNMAWTDTERGARYAFETRWSGALARADGDWRFVEMHVSTREDGRG